MSGSQYKWDDVNNDNTVNGYPSLFNTEYVGFICEWDTSPTPPPSGDQIADFEGESVSVGSILRWKHRLGGVGYRVFRSESKNTEGVSINEFYITTNVFVDVNVRQSTTYYYTVRQVISEAKPQEGKREELGPVTSQVTVTTPSTLVGGNLTPPSPNAVKSYILMTIDDPNMNINGTSKEIDPGRGTAPLIQHGRTMVPIRAIVEGMGGNVGWQDSNQEITLDYGQRNVRMWLNRSDISANGSSGTMDVVPVSINSRTMVPIRFAAENLGCDVDWLSSTRQVVIVYY
jgi:hypothetical protein